MSLSIPRMKLLKSNIDPEVPHMFRERAITMKRAGGPRMDGLAFSLKGPGKLVSMAMILHSSSLVTKQSLCEKRGV